MLASPQNRVSYFLNLQSEQEMDNFVTEIVRERHTLPERVMSALETCSLSMQSSESRAMIKACVLRKIHA